MQGRICGIDEFESAIQNTVVENNRLSLSPEGANEGTEVFDVITLNGVVTMEVQVAANVWVGVLFIS